MKYVNSGRPHYMREIGTEKLGLHLMNFHKKTQEDFKLKEVRFLKQRHFSIAKIREIADKKTAHNEVCL